MKHMLVIGKAENGVYDILRATWPPQLATDDQSGTAYEEGRTNFLNVDFEVLSRTPLDALVAALGRKVFVLYQGKWKPGYAAMFELATGWNWPADRRITRFVQAVETLPRRERRLWDGATARRFDIGIEAGYTPHMFQLRLKPSTVEAVSRVGGEIVVSVYEPVVAKR